MCKFRTLNDSPVTLGDWEKAENVYDYEYNFEKNASEEEVEAMHNHESQENPMPYRKKKAITKIFRRSTYLPGLEDIEEGEEEQEPPEDYVASSEDEYDMSLSAIHQARAWRYCSRPMHVSHHRSRHRHHHHSHRDAASEGQAVNKKRRRHTKADTPG